MDVNEPKMENHLERMTDERLPGGKRNVARPIISPDVCCVKGGKTHLKYSYLSAFRDLDEIIKHLRHALKSKIQQRC
jgi:hypothetical protein